MKKNVIDRAEDLEFELANGSAFVVRPYNRRQMRAAIALDPKPGEARTPAQIGEQRARQLEELVGPLVLVRDEVERYVEKPSREVLEQLTGDEEMQILAAILAQGHGQDPRAALSLHQIVKKKAILASLAACATSTPTPSSSPSSSAAP